MPEWILRWMAIGLLALITFIFIVLGAAVLSGLTNDLFHAFLELTWPDRRVAAMASFEPDSREQISFSILNYGITAMGTAWVASFAYLVVMRNQQKQTEQQLSMARLQLTTDLDEQILDVLESEGVVDFGVDGKPLRVRLISVLDRNTQWRAGTDRDWKYREGERTVAFVDTSGVVGKNAEVSVSALQRYLGWIRRIMRAIETGVLHDRDVLLFWRWVVIGCYKGRYPFMRDIFFKDDLDDFVALVDRIVVTGAKESSGRDFVGYLQTLGEPELIALLSDEAKAIITPEAVAAA